MTEKTENEKVADFLNEMRDLFNANAAIFKAADKRLEERDFKGFEQVYRSLKQEELVDIAMAQHLKVNEVFGHFKQRSDSLMAILTDISNCKDFVVFDDLKKKARVILMAQQMVERGANPEEVEKMMKEQQAGLATSNLIVQ